MGLHVADSDSELLNEKGQTTTAHKRSRCPWILLVQILRQHQEKREKKIEEVRMRINNDRKKMEANQCPSWQGTTSTEQRRSIWEGGLGSSSLKCCGYTFSTSHTHKVTTQPIKAGSVGNAIHDFRTPEGREEAFKWWDARHQRYERNGAHILKSYDSWEETYQKYVKKHDVVDRKILLQRVPQIIWCTTKVEKLSN